MRIAIFSDVHGNLPALEAVLADIAAQSGIDQLICAGDICLFGPEPAACLDKIRAAQLATVYGNTDQWLVRPPEVTPDMDEATAARWSKIGNLAQWHQAQLGQARLAWLASRPFAIRISPTADPANELLITHANPLDVNQLVFPAEAEQERLYGRIRQPDHDLEPLLGQTTATMIAYGHLHVPGIREWQGKTLVNVSSVSLPGDGDSQAKYAILSWNGRHWSVAHRRVAYSVAPLSEAFRTHQPPDWETAVQQLVSTGLVAQVV
jgi:predicted phosphodiesterase